MPILLTFDSYANRMKALAVILILLLVGDLVFDHGAGVSRLGHAGHEFLQDFEQDFADSFFAA